MTWQVKSNVGVVLEVLSMSIRVENEETRRHPVHPYHVSTDFTSDPNICVAQLKVACGA